MSILEAVADDEDLSGSVEPGRPGPGELRLIVALAQGALCEHRVDGGTTVGATLQLAIAGALGQPPFEPIAEPVGVGTELSDLVGAERGLGTGLLGVGLVGSVGRRMEVGADERPGGEQQQRQRHRGAARAHGTATSTSSSLGTPTPVPWNARR